MPPSDPRRSISISGATYRRLQAHCAPLGISISAFVEERIKVYLGDEPPVPIDDSGCAGERNLESPVNSGSRGSVRRKAVGNASPRNLPTAYPRTARPGNGLSHPGKSVPPRDGVSAPERSGRVSAAQRVIHVRNETDPWTIAKR